MKTVEIVLWTGLHVRKSDLDSGTLDAIRSSWVYPNPSFELDQRLREKEMADYEKAKEEGRTMRVQYAWREAPAETIQCYDEDDEWIVVPRGTGTRLLRAILKERGYQAHVSDRRNEGEVVDVRRSKLWEPYYYQDQACVALHRAQRGYVLADTAAGKTVIGCEFIARTGRVTLVLAHTGEILDGWRDEILGNDDDGTVAKLDGDFRLTRLQGKKGALKAVREGDIILGTIQTLYRCSQEVLDVLNKRVGLVVNDETHHAPAETFWAALSRLAAKRRHGLTATDKRKDRKDFLLTEVIGPCVYKIDDSVLAASGKVRTPTVEFIALDFYPRIETRNRKGKMVADAVASREIAESSYNRVRLLNMMVEDDARNNAIADRIEADWKAGHICGVVTERVKHCALLKQKLEERGMVVGVLKGGASAAVKKAKRRVKADVASGKTDVVVGTSVFDEGVNIPTLSAMHLVLPGNNEARTKQRAGRARRPEGHAKTLVRDYVDYRCPAVIDAYKNRRRWYRRWKWKVRDINITSLLS